MGDSSFLIPVNTSTMRRVKDGLLDYSIGAAQEATMLCDRELSWSDEWTSGISMKVKKDTKWVVVYAGRHYVQTTYKGAIGYDLKKSDYTGKKKWIKLGKKVAGNPL